jgi:conjugal transfer mating pair stabilization protein TraN
MIKLKCLAAIVTLTAINSAALAAAYAPGACSEVPGSQTCTDSTPCKTMSNGLTACLAGATLAVGALQLTETCWNFSYSYACKEAAPVDGCTAYENNPACSLVNSVCTDTLAETGACDSWNYTYQCLTAAATTASQLVCSSTSLFNTSSLTAPSNSNNTAMTAALALEIGRETQVYGAGGTVDVFVGVAENCTKGYAGIKNCCNAVPGAQSDQSFLTAMEGSAAFSAIKYVGQSAVDLASPYVFDAMYSSGLFSAGLMFGIADSASVTSGLVGGNYEAISTNFAANGVSLGAYGFTYGTGTFNSASALPGTIDLSSDVGLGAGSSVPGYLSFNPYVFVAMLVINELISLHSCTPEEQLLAMHRGSDLSVYVNEVCNSKFLGSCLLYQDNYCSFNSILAKIINVQGKQQLGLNFADCSGLTIAQVSSLNFSAINFSEFTASMMQQAEAGLPTSITAGYTPVMQSTAHGAGQTSSNGLAYPAATTAP